MSYSAIMEVLLHLNNYKIHDAYAEGRYRLRFSVYNEIQDSSNPKELIRGKNLLMSAYGQPYLSPNKQLYNLNDFDDISMEISGNVFYTDPFVMEYRRAKKTRLLNNMCLFRLELPCYPDIWTDPLILQSELLVQVNPV